MGNFASHNSFSRIKFRFKLVPKNKAPKLIRNVRYGYCVLWHMRCKKSQINRSWFNNSVSWSFRLILFYVSIDVHLVRSVRRVCVCMCVCVYVVCQHKTLPSQWALVTQVFQLAYLFRLQARDDSHQVILDFLYEIVQHECWGWAPNTISIALIHLIYFQLLRKYLLLVKIVLKSSLRLCWLFLYFPWILYITSKEDIICVIVSVVGR